ncbi:MAG: Tad domain-containing protein [Armatimonadetes bacterium]|nr:Tad domain-containing protein [Armatimonadota bacterium]MDW8123035.1 Tad domain-containing protein [Armatimonadota bacterium]
MNEVRRGSVGILVALGIVAFLMMAALVVDIGSAILARQDVQINVDASILAAAMELRTGPSSAKAVAADYYSRNMKGNPAPVVVSCPAGSDPNTTCYQIGGDQVEVTSPAPPPQGGPPDSRRIKIRACRTVRYFFAPIIGVVSKRTCAEATARASVLPTGLVILDRTGSGALHVENHSTFKVTGGTLIVNSNHVTAFTIENNSRMVSDVPLEVVGGVSVHNRASVNPLPVRASGPVDDPLAHLPAPEGTNKCGTARELTFNNGNHILRPNIYGRITVTGNATVTLDPGIYILCSGLEVSGNAVLEGSGVLLYFHGGSLELGGNATVNLTPYTQSPYNGLTIFQARGNSSEMTTQGTPSVSMTGIVYMPNGQATIGGKGEFSRAVFVVNRLRVKNNAEVTISAEPYPLLAPSSSVVLEN